MRVDEYTISRSPVQSIGLPARAQIIGFTYKDADPVIHVMTPDDEGPQTERTLHLTKQINHFADDELVYIAFAMAPNERMTYLFQSKDLGPVVMQARSVANKWFVGAQGDQIVVLSPPARMDREDALTFAAWIVALADDHGEFGEILEAVKNT